MDKVKKELASCIGCLLVFSLLFQTGCNTTGPTEFMRSPGEFKLTWLKGLRKAPTSTILDHVGTTEKDSFYLGDVNGSTDFYFVLTNSGTEPITDVSLSMSDSSFLIFPESIDVFPPGTEVNLLELHDVSILRLTAVHGPPYRTPRHIGLMGGGLNSSVLTITGTTLDRLSESISLRLDAGVVVNALLMDVKIWDGSREVDLLNSDGAILTGGFEVADAVRMYNMTDTVRIENAGSVPVFLKIFRNDYTDTLYVGEIFTLGRWMTSYVRLDGNGAVQDLARFPQYSNGRTYIYLRWN